MEISYVNQKTFTCSPPAGPHRMENSTSRHAGLGMNMREKTGVH